jgi:hypothetical protein
VSDHLNYSAKRLRDDPSLAFPWPYSEDQINAVIAAMPARARLHQNALAIVRFARVFRAQNKLARSRAEVSARNRPQPYLEISNVQRTVEDARLALHALSPEALEIIRLSEHQSDEIETAIVNAKVALIEIKRLTQAFSQSERLPPRIGAPPQSRHFSNLLIALEIAWGELNGGNRTARGKWTFFQCALNFDGSKHLSRKRLEAALPLALRPRKQQK